jgi:hypothetical protein
MSGSNGRDGRHRSASGKRSYVKSEAERTEDRVDWKWLNARESGELPLPAHDPDRIAEYRRLGAAISELPELFAPEGWSDAVLAEAARMDAARASKLDLFDASEVSTERDRIRLAATRTKTWLASGTDSGLAVVNTGLEGDVPDSEELVDWRAARPAEPQRATRPQRDRWPLLAMTSLAMVAAALLWLVLRGSSTSAPAPESTPVPVIASADLDEPKMEIVRGHARAGEAAVAAVGDTFTATLVMPAGRTGELRLYRDDREVVARCPGTPGCTSRVEPEVAATSAIPEPADGAAARRLSLRFPLLAPGSYRLVYLEGAALGEPSGDFDRDLARCGCKMKMLPPVSVR